MLEDDFIVRQIKMIAQLAARLAGAEEEEEEEEEQETDDQVAEAYRSILGLDSRQADAFTASTLLRMVHERGLQVALVELTAAHGDLEKTRGRPEAAELRWNKALAMLDLIGGEPELRESLLARSR